MIICTLWYMYLGMVSVYVLLTELENKQLRRQLTEARKSRDHQVLQSAITKSYNFTNGSQLADEK